MARLSPPPIPKVRANASGPSGGRRLPRRPPRATSATTSARAARPLAGCGAGARVRGAGPDGHLRTGRAGRPADPRCQEAPAGGNFPDRGAVAVARRSRRSCRTRRRPLQGARDDHQPGAPHECVSLEYAVATAFTCRSKNELLSRFGHEEGLLDKLAAAPAERKARLKERIRQIADRLMRIAAERALRSAPILEAPHYYLGCSAPASPTRKPDDQLSAIEEVVTDLAEGLDGPAHRRRRGLRQDRGGDARGLRRCHARACRSR